MSNENIIGPTVKILRHEYLYLHASKLKLLPLCGERLHQMLIRVFFFAKRRFIAYCVWRMHFASYLRSTRVIIVRLPVEFFPKEWLILYFFKKSPGIVITISLEKLYPSSFIKTFNFILRYLLKHLKTTKSLIKNSFYNLQSFHNLHNLF